MFAFENHMLLSLFYFCCAIRYIRTHCKRGTNIEKQLSSTSSAVLPCQACCVLGGAFPGDLAVAILPRRVGHHILMCGSDGELRRWKPGKSLSYGSLGLLLLVVTLRE